MLRVVIAAVARFGGGCASIRNLGTEPVGDQPPGLVYGGVRYDASVFIAYPIGTPIVPAVVIAGDAITDTVTIPYTLARQLRQWLLDQMLAGRKPGAHIHPTHPATEMSRGVLVEDK